MDRNTITGFILIALLLMLWSYLNTPSDEEIQRQQAIQDSIRMEMAETPLVPAEAPDTILETLTETPAEQLTDSVRMALNTTLLAHLVPPLKEKKKSLRWKMNCYL